jgi:hypothetical protein
MESTDNSLTEWGNKTATGVGSTLNGVLAQIDSTIRAALDKVFESAFTNEMLQDCIQEKLLLLKGVDPEEIRFTLSADNKSIQFKNLYTALVYMGFWDEESQDFTGGKFFKNFQPNLDYFLMDNGTKVGVDGIGNLLVHPVQPIEYIKLNLVITKEGIVNGD